MITLFIALIIWCFSIMQADHYIRCRHYKNNKCPKDIEFIINKLTAILYVILIPVMVILGFALKNYTPVTILVVVWILKMFVWIFMNLDRFGYFFIASTMLASPSNRSSVNSNRSMIYGKLFRIIVIQSFDSGNRTQKIQ